VALLDTGARRWCYTWGRLTLARLNRLLFPVYLAKLGLLLGPLTGFHQSERTGTNSGYGIVYALLAEQYRGTFLS
jgi:hypothetical protein